MSVVQLACKISCAKVKEYFISQRREAFAESDEDKYEKIVMHMTNAEEGMVQENLIKLFKMLGLESE